MKTPLMIAAAACAWAGVQEQSPNAEQQLLLHSNTQLVQVNVVVHNRKGEPVADLKKEDFSITERGKAQAISFFSVESTGKPASFPEKLPPDVFSNELYGTMPSSVTVILLDALNTELKDQIYPKDQVARFLGQIHPDDRVAIYSLGRSLKVLHDYMGDPKNLPATLAKFRGLDLPDPANSQVDTGGARSSVDARAGTQMEAEFSTTNRVLNTLNALEAIAQHLTSIPGRKNLIWVSSGFPLRIDFGGKSNQASRLPEQRTYVQEVNHAIQALNNANVAMYPVDARGLQVGADVAGANSRNPARRGPFEPVVTNLETMNELASRTGGQAFYNGNDLDRAIRNAIDDARVTYTLGYYPAHDEQDNNFREIRIKIDRPGLSARYRNGYFPVRELQPDGKTRRAQLDNAAWSPLDATAIKLNARINVVNEPVPETIRVVTQIDLSTVKLEQKMDKWAGLVDLIYVQKDDKGRVLPGGVTHSIVLNLSKETYLNLLKTGLVYQQSFPRQPKSESVRVAVRDASSGSAGSITVSFSQLAN